MKYAEGVRKDLGIQKELAEGYEYRNLSKSAEVARLCCHCKNCFSRRNNPEAKYNSADLRDDFIREMKKTRSVIAKADEGVWIPAVMRKAIMDAIWDKGAKGNVK